MTESEKRTILSAVDHTNLAVDATWEDIQTLCDDGIRYGTASVCIPPAFVRKAKAYVAGKIPVCTVIGFPNGYHTTAVKVAETADAVQNGADEIDMVIRVGWVKEEKWQALTDEIAACRVACPGKILKVIVETCLLTNEEKAKLCSVVAAGGADYIKTSTGFSHGGATPEDIEIFAKNCPPGLQIKAAGGIANFADAARLMALGATRLGTSRLVKIEKGNTPSTCY